MPTTDPSAPIRVLLLGCGRIGAVHAAQLAADSRGVVSVVCDPDPDSARRIASSLSSGARVAGSLDEALAHQDFDAAVICTPTGQHFEQVVQLRSAGIPVLCEKPLADSRDRLATLAAASRTGPLLSIAYQRRYSATFRTLRNEVLSGRHGRVRSVVVYNCERWAQTIAGTWRDDPAQNPGGFLGDAGSHKVDMVFHVTGLAAREVFARSSRRNWRVDVTTQISAVLGEDVPLSMAFIGDAEHFTEEFRIHCEGADLYATEGRIEIARDNHRELIPVVQPESNPDVAFLDSLRGEAANEAPAGIALPIWDFTFGALESARSGRPVNLESLSAD